MPPSPFIELREISYYPENSSQPLLHQLDFSINPNDHVGLIGPNGSGKTTLMQIIVGLLSPAKGTILFAGREMRDEKDFYQLRKQVGFLFQSSDDQLFSPTVLEDVAFGPLNLGLTAEEAKETAITTLNNLGLAGFEERITHRLSGGEKKLVALATILAMNPKLLLLDEPTNNLDPNTRLRLIEILQDLQMAYVIISHDFNFLEETTSCLHTLDNGQLHRCEHTHVHTHRHIHPYGNKPHQHE